MKLVLKSLLLLILFIISTISRAQEEVFAGADESTRSKAQYFSWINNTNEGTTEDHTQINLDFFGWLKSEYGMQLDIYAFDAGAIDGKRFYGSMKSDRFKSQFPYGFDSIYHKANHLGIRLGVWGGPDGFGDTTQEEEERTDQMVGLCRDYDFALFKFDAVCGPLRLEKEDAFIRMMEECRRYSPDLILLNHRLGLEKAKAYATTFLWGGAETYIDVFMTNNATAPHHRAAALTRGLVPDLKRLTEDHGVCISSCLDNWDDDLILQAFNRSLILAPQIYGNPWLLRDDEYPRLARIYNLHRKYGEILVNGLVLPESSYGPHAVSRGNEETRLITMRNISWNPTNYEIQLGEEIGMADTKSVRVVQIHPYEKLIGDFKSNDKVTVAVEPFRSALFIVTSEEYDEPLVKGVAFNVVRNVEGKSILIDLLEEPGAESEISLAEYNDYKSVRINGAINKNLLKGKLETIHFKGETLNLKAGRKIADMPVVEIPADAESLYEATIYSADNNALEVRSLLRSGESTIPEVKNARDVFFNQDAFVNRGIWDRNLFDSNMETGFWPSKKYDIDLRVKGGALRLDLGEIVHVDQIVVHVPNHYAVHPLLPEEGNYVDVSTDLITWKTVTFLAGTKMTINIGGNVRYLRFKRQPQQIVEIEGYYNGKPLDRTKWRASNLFAYPDRMQCEKSWSAKFALDEIANNSYLSVALNGKHGVEGAYVAARIDGKLVGAPDRAASYPSNTWEYVNAKRDANYTYYIPLKEADVGKEIEVFVLAYDKENTGIQPEIWISQRAGSMEKMRLELVRK